MGVMNVGDETTPAAARELRAAIRGKEINMSLSSFLTSTIDEKLYSSNNRRDVAFDVAFMDRFGRCNSLLHFLAYRILGTHEGAGDAVENCSIVALLNPPDFKYEGAFHSWVARILIDETLAILRQTDAALTELSK